MVAYRFDRQPVEGFVTPSTYLLDTGAEVLSPSGSIQVIAYDELKAVCFVNEPGRFDLFRADHFFERRPKIPGLWTRFTLRDGEQIDGVLPPNLNDWPQQGYVLTPPKSSAARQKVFIPRSAVSKTELQGVIGPAKSQPKAKATKAGADQLRMFE